MYELVEYFNRVTDTILAPFQICDIQFSVGTRTFFASDVPLSVLFCYTFMVLTFNNLKIPSGVNLLGTASPVTHTCL